MNSDALHQYSLADFIYKVLPVLFYSLNHIDVCVA